MNKYMILNKYFNQVFNTIKQINYQYIILLNIIHKN